MKPFIKSIQIGKVESFGDSSKTNFFLKHYETASFKKVVPLGEVTLTGFIGDEVADKESHGGEEKAIFANSYENYPHWCSFLDVAHLPFGALAENLTISGLDETTVFLGDIHIIGGVTLQVSQPRKPCWKIARNHNNQNFTKEIYESGLTGWYYHVLKMGTIKQGDSIEIISNEMIKISIQEANQAFREPTEYKSTLLKILEITSLSKNYKKSIEKRLDGTANLRYMEIEDEKYTFNNFWDFAADRWFL